MARVTWRAELLWWTAIALVGAWVVLWANWWSLISAIVVIVAYIFFLTFSDYYRHRGDRSRPMPRGARWFVIALIAHSGIGLVIAIYRHAL